MMNFRFLGCGIASSLLLNALWNISMHLQDWGMSALDQWGLAPKASLCKWFASDVP